MTQEQGPGTDGSGPVFRRTFAGTMITELARGLARGITEFVHARPNGVFHTHDQRIQESKNG